MFVGNVPVRVTVVVMKDVGTTGGALVGGGLLMVGWVGGVVVVVRVLVGVVVVVVGGVVDEPGLTVSGRRSAGRSVWAGTTS